ncbi:Na+/H+ antiporter subunit G [Maritimibacter sp. UBA3975]|uniref:Na+/H+ antiporter subunit G n=1 Tax=Maritimibacter sp. UBA3975 TaxID=1946833 RepID=UPI000C0ABE15|nr:Na+/H+ antiporter subunit G [Maritimibacter sp. UBA3975]MAM62875.1 Na+/H+ antiporter subunit G [Maritimibacter sp.]|tara:strand:+ start:55152 stop:55547 length:396 start_codon:yes stop_codon:yes gene_type:complete
MEQFAEILISAFLVIAGIFGLAGSYGLVKLRDTMQRLHAPTKATTLGVGGVLIASMLYFGLIRQSLSFHELLISIFLFLTAPITANFIAKTFLAQNVKPEDIPETDRAYGWAVYEDPPGGTGVEHEDQRGE